MAKDIAANNTILIVEDDAVMREIVKIQLESYGYRIITAGDCATGLKLFKQRPVDVVITDINMPPDPDAGFNLLKLIQLQSNSVPVIILSGSENIREIKKALHLGAYDYVCKNDMMNTDKETPGLLEVLNRAFDKLALHNEKELYKNQLKSIIKEQAEEIEIAQRKLEQQRLFEQQQSDKFRQVHWSLQKSKLMIENTASGIASINKLGDITEYNPAFLKNLDIDEAEMKNKSILLHPKLGALNLYDQVIQCLNFLTPISATTELKTRDQSTRILCYTLTPFCLDQFDFEKEVLINIDDITLQKEKEQELEKKAYIDELTGLTGQNRFPKPLLPETVERAIRKQSTLALVHVDIDDFKAVNTRYGHPMASLLLSLIGQRILQSINQDKDLGIRSGGDEFAILLIDYRLDTLTRIVERIINKLKEPYHVESSTNKEEIRCTFSVGVSELDLINPQSADLIYEQADEATYEAKHTGKDKIVFFTLQGMQTLTLPID